MIRSLWSREFERARHYYPRIAMVTCLGLLLGSITTSYPWWFVLLHFTLLAAWMFAIIESGGHWRRSCDRCMLESCRATDVPAGSSVKARLHRGVRTAANRYCHIRLRVYVPLLLGLCVSLVAATFLPKPWIQLAPDVTYLAVLCSVVLPATHQRNLRYCPQCNQGRGGGGGNWTPVLMPDPLTTDARR